MSHTCPTEFLARSSCSSNRFDTEVRILVTDAIRYDTLQSCNEYGFLLAQQIHLFFFLMIYMFIVVLPAPNLAQNLCTCFRCANNHNRNHAVPLCLRPPYVSTSLTISMILELNSTKCCVFSLKEYICIRVKPQSGVQVYSKVPYYFTLTSLYTLTCPVIRVFVTYIVKCK